MKIKLKNYFSTVASKSKRDKEIELQDYIRQTILETDYDGSIETMDAQIEHLALTIGRMLDTLATKGLLSLAEVFKLLPGQPDSSSESIEIIKEKR